MSKPIKKSLRSLDLIPLTLRCVLCGALTGAGIFIFKLAASNIEKLSRELYGNALENKIFIPALISIVVLLSFAMYFIHKKAPEVRGGGIPRSEGVLRGILSCRPIVTLAGTAIGSFIGFLCGLPIGSEGPAVLIGTCIGAFFCGRDGIHSPISRYVSTGGAGAGFAVATCAPLSAILFALEEIHKRFTPVLVLSVSASVLSATLVNKYLCGFFGIPTRLFQLGNLPSFTLGNVGYLLLFGVITAFAVALFDLSIVHFSAFIKRVGKRFPHGFGIVLVFLLVCALGFVFPEALYSGHHLIEELVFENIGVLFIGVILLARLIMMLFVTGSGATGGIFIPTLAIGCLASAIIGRLMVFLGFPADTYSTLVFLGMCAFLGGTLRAPLTASVLFTELTGHFSDFFYVALVVFTVIIITDVLNLTPFYDSVLESLEHSENRGKKRQTEYFRLTISEKSFIVGKAVRDVMWPHGSVVVGVRHLNDRSDDTDNDGEMVLQPGDTLIIRSAFFNIRPLMNYLQSLAGKDGEISVMEK